MTPGHDVRYAAVVMSPPALVTTVTTASEKASFSSRRVTSPSRIPNPTMSATLRLTNQAMAVMKAIRRVKTFRLATNSMMRAKIPSMGPGYCAVEEEEAPSEHSNNNGIVMGAGGADYCIQL